MLLHVQKQHRQDSGLRTKPLTASTSGFQKNGALCLCSSFGLCRSVSHLKIGGQLLHPRHATVKRCWFLMQGFVKGPFGQRPR